MTQPFSLPMFQAGYGQSNSWGTYLPPGGRVAAYVGSANPRSYDDRSIQALLVPTLAAALTKVRAGAGDTIYVLPGHSENVTGATMLDGLVAGTRIIGCGYGSNRPVFRWTATTSKWNVAVADCVFANLNLRIEGAVVVKGIYVTGADCVFANNIIQTSSGASNVATIVMEYDTGADRFVLSDNKFYGLLAGASTDGVLVTAALTDWEIKRNTMIFPSTAATKGLIHLVGASLNGYIGFNALYNTVASSVPCIYFDDVASDGLCEYNRCAVTVGTGSAPNVTGILKAGTNTLWRFIENYSTPTKNTSGDISPVRDT